MFNYILEFEVIIEGRDIERLMHETLGKIFLFLECYTALPGSYLLMFQDNQLVPSSRV